MESGTGRRPISVPRVSVVIPAFNAEPFIHRTIASVLDQTFKDLEVLVVDDGSTDATTTIVQAFDDRVRLIPQTNSGVAAARNRGLVEARGEFVAFIDHDDLWYPDKLQQQVELLDAKPNVGLVYGNAQFVDLSDRRMWTYLSPARLHRGSVLVPLFLDCFIPLLTVIMRADLLEKIGTFVPRWHIAEDYDLFLRASERTEVDYVDGIVAGYRIHPGNVSRDFSRRLTEEQEVLASCLNRNPDLRQTLGESAVRLRMAGLRCEPGHALLFRGQFAEARRYFGRRLPGQVVLALPLWLAGRLGPRFVMGARTVYRRVREKLSGAVNPRMVQRSAG
jgi:hypothetical protein